MEYYEKTVKKGDSGFYFCIKSYSFALKATLLTIGSVFLGGRLQSGGPGGR